MKAVCLILSAFVATHLTAHGQNLLVGGDFESPKIDGRVPAATGGNPVLFTESSWARLTAKEGGDGGRLIVGLTTEIAHGGKQALFVDFQQLTAPSQIASLMTKLVAIKPSQSYRVGIWGRMDRKRPLALDERTPFMQVDIEFVEADQETIAGEGAHAILVIPAATVPGETPSLLFVARRWNKAEATVQTPPNAAFMRVTWSWATAASEGETDGTIYWDDATIEEGTSDAANSPPAGPASPGGTPAEPAKPGVAPATVPPAQPVPKSP